MLIKALLGTEHEDSSKIVHLGAAFIAVTIQPDVLIEELAIFAEKGAEKLAGDCLICKLGVESRFNPSV